MQYVGQNGSLYVDCVLRAMVNACRFYGINCPDPSTDAWEAALDFAGCRKGPGTRSVEELAEFFGLRAVPVPFAQVVGQLPLLLPVWNPEVGPPHHTALVVGWSGRVATVVNYRSSGEPLVERLPLSFERQPPVRTDGTTNHDLYWGALYVPPFPEDRSYVLELP